MKKGIVASFIALLFLSAAPLANAQATLPSGPGAISGLSSFSLPTVPTSNPALEAKETGINILGFRVPISWDGLAIQIAKKFIERMVDSTVQWINTGFDGNPAYVTDPKQYFGDIADGVAGEFLNDSNLDFLCSPFQAQVRIALQKSYTQAAPFQCRLTQVIANIDNFYDDFSQGGWDAWFAMTQDNANNPYGAYIEAKVELDSRLAAAIGVEREKLQWGGGFLSREECPQDATPITDNGQTKCVDKTGKPVPKRIVTPGTTINSQLENVLGTGIRQLELADEFDELIGALLGQLLEKSVFSAKGLFGSNHKVSSSGNNPNSPQNPAGGGGETGTPTEWVWNDRGGPAFESAKCPGINPEAYFAGLRGDAPISAWQATLDSVQGGLWACGIGEQRTSGGEARGRLFLPTTQCPDASPEATDAKLGVRQNPACWLHEVDVLGFSPVGNTPTDTTEPGI